MKKVAILIVMIISLFAFAQGKAKTPEVPLATQNKINRLMKEQARLVIQMQSLQTQYQMLQSQNNEKVQEASDAVKQAIVDAKLDPKEWQLDTDKMEFVKIKKN